MFLNDPMLYGATLPYRDLQTPVQGFLPWQNIPRWVPPFYGFQTPYFNLVNPWIHTGYTHPFYQVPQVNVPPFNIPQMNIPQMNIPQMNIPQMNIPQLNWPRPLCY